MSAAPGTGAVRLRGHHLICLQFFRGEGYNADYVDNLARVVARAADLPALVVATADDVCAACPDLGNDGRCASDSAGGEAEIARIDALALEILGLSVGDRLTLTEARARLEADAVGAGRWLADSCDGCEWERTCEGGWNAMLREAQRAARAED